MRLELLILIGPLAGLASWSRWLIRSSPSPSPRWLDGLVALALVAVAGLGALALHQMEKAIHGVASTAPAERQAMLSRAAASATQLGTAALGIAALWLLVLAVATVKRHRALREAAGPIAIARPRPRDSRSRSAGD